MPWRIADYTSADENIENQCILNRATNVTYRSLKMTIQIANDILQRYSGEFIIPEDFKFKKEEKGALLTDGHIKRSFQIPGSITECSVYIIYVQPYKAPVLPVGERRRSERVREPVHYGEDNFNYERWIAREQAEEDPEDVEEEDVEFVEEIPAGLMEQFNNFHIGAPVVPRYLLNNYH
jgi:hypothetical protein